MSSKIERAKQICDYSFDGAPQMLATALRAPGSFLASPEGNKPLASIGDRVLNLHIAEHGVAQSWSIGAITEHIKANGNNDRLAAICRSTGLEQCIETAVGQSGPIGKRTLADTIEAVIGAAYKSGGMTAAVAVMNSLEVV